MCVCVTWHPSTAEKPPHGIPMGFLPSEALATFSRCFCTSALFSFNLCIFYDVAKQGTAALKAPPALVFLSVVTLTL